VLVLVRCVASNEKAAAFLREFLTARLESVISRLTDRPDGRLRASLVAAQLVGIAMLRHAVWVDPIAEATSDELISRVGPGIEQYLK
jgi:hypothetical protein